MVPSAVAVGRAVQCRLAWCAAPCKWNQRTVTSCPAPEAPWRMSGSCLWRSPNLAREKSRQAPILGNNLSQGAGTMNLLRSKAADEAWQVRYSGSAWLR